MAAQVLAGRLGIEGGDADAHVVHIVGVRPRSRAAALADDAVHRHEIDQRRARAQLDQAQVVAPALHRATQNTGVEIQRPVQVRDPQNDVVDAGDRKAIGVWGSGHIRFSLCGCHSQLS